MKYYDYDCNDNYIEFEEGGTTLGTIFAILSGLIIQLIIFALFDVSVKDVPLILIAVLWLGFSAVTLHIVDSLGL